MTGLRPAIVALAVVAAITPPARAAGRFQWDAGPTWTREFARPLVPPSPEEVLLGACRPLPRSRPQFSLHYSEVEEGDSARRPNHEGRGAPDGLHGEVEAGGRFVGPGPLSIRVRPRLNWNADAASVDWLEACATVAWSHVAVDAGRTRLWLGPARSGSLLLSNNAHPLDLVHLRAGSGTPSTLPVLEWLRSVEGGLAVATLRDEDRDYANPDLAVAHLALSWSGWLEVDLYRTLLFGGEGRDVEIDWETIRDLILALGENHVDPSKNLSDQLAAIAFTARPLALFGRQPAPGSDSDLVVFYEYAGEDNLKGIFPGSPGVSLGFTAHRGPWEGTGEVAVNNNLQGAWYEHLTYTSGYTYRGEILGHRMGGDALSVSGETAFPLPALRIGRVALDMTESGYLTLPEPRRVWTAAASVERIASGGRFDLAADVVGRWSEGGEPPDPIPLERLRATLRITLRTGPAA